MTIAIFPASRMMTASVRWRRSIAPAATLMVFAELPSEDRRSAESFRICAPDRWFC
jgi:hypothetical protein